MTVFFYGLFMDVNILKKNGITPSKVQKGYVQDYTLKIGNRASLITSKNDKAYGLVIDVDQHILDKLYAEPSVADYVPEEVSVHLNSGEKVIAWCYNLPLHSLSGTNISYANSLYHLAQQLKFPQSYLDKIKKNLE